MVRGIVKRDIKYEMRFRKQETLKDIR